MASGQTEPKHQEHFKNCLALRSSARHHFDGNPNSLIYNLDYPFSPRFNLSFTRRIGAKKAVTIEWDSYWAVYNTEIKGNVFGRGNQLFAALFETQIWQYEQNALFMQLGASYRYGHETVFINRYTWHINVISRFLNDLGPTLGLQFQRDIGKRWRLLAKTDYTYYAYVRHKGSVYDFDEGATRHLARVHLGVGYKFNFNFRREKHDE